MALVYELWIFTEIATGWEKEVAAAKGREMVKDGHKERNGADGAHHGGSVSEGGRGCTVSKRAQGVRGACEGLE